MLPFKFKAPTFTDEDGPGSCELRAINTATPGILLTESTEITGTYRLTHEPSGMAINTGAFGTTSDVFGLLTLAGSLATLGDWTRPAYAIGIDKVLMKATRAMLASAPIEWQALAWHAAHEAASAATRARN